MRKIIHVDMDCFYAAIEIRDNPALHGKPVAVGGTPQQRGVICTCNYPARKYGVHSAMATATALRLCPDLILLPVDMPKYRSVARAIHQIFHEYSDLVEPLALDEAYIDVSDAPHHQNSATWMAEAIRAKIWQTQQLTASAGVAPNKLLAKIASGWHKPNGLFVIRPHEVNEFVKTLAVDELYGVGKVTAQKLHRLHIKTCADLQRFSKTELIEQFSKLGERLYDQCRGVDNRSVQPDRIRKSLSVERTFPEDIPHITACLDIIHTLYQKLLTRIGDSAPDVSIKNQFIKIKLSDFRQISAEVVSHEVNLECFLRLFREAYANNNKAIRLLGMGVHFNHASAEIESNIQISLFD